MSLFVCVWGTAWELAAEPSNSYRYRLRASRRPGDSEQTCVAWVGQSSPLYTNIQAQTCALFSSKSRGAFDTNKEPALSRASDERSFALSTKCPVHGNGAEHDGDSKYKRAKAKVPSIKSPSRQHEDPVRSDSPQADQMRRTGRLNPGSRCKRKRLFVVPAATGVAASDVGRPDLVGVAWCVSRATLLGSCPARLTVAARPDLELVAVRGLAVGEVEAETLVGDGKAVVLCVSECGEGRDARGELITPGSSKGGSRAQGPHMRNSRRCSTTAAGQGRRSTACGRVSSRKDGIGADSPELDLGAVGGVGAGVKAEVGASNLDLLVAADEGELLGGGVVAGVAGGQRCRAVRGSHVGEGGLF